MTNREVWLDAAKGVGILLVVSAHIAGAGSSWWDGAFANAVLLFHMPLFFVISGYVYKPADRSQLFWKKVTSLLVPYVAFLSFLTIAVIARNILLHEAPAPWELREMVVNDLLGGMRLWQDFGVFWFVTCLFLTQIVYNEAATWAKGPGTLRMVGFIAVCIVLGYAIQTHWPMNRSPWAVAAVPIALCCYWFGDLLRTHQFRLRTLSLFVATVGVVALAVAANGADIQFNMKYSIFGPPVVGLLIALALSVTVLMLVRRAAAIAAISAPMAKLGEASLVIMFLHQFFHFSLRSVGVANEAVILLAAVFGPYVIYLLLKRSAWLSPWFLGTGTGAPARAIAWIRNGLGWRLEQYRADAVRSLKPEVAKALIALRWPLRRKGRPHSLSADLIVSLTSYPKRFSTLHLTLRCLLTQTVAPDRIILWVTAEDAGQLPASVTDLKSHGLEIRFCRDIRSYKKIVPALLAFPTAYIVTADDDVYYSAKWLEELVEHADERTVVFHRGHAVAFDDGGQIAPYNKWKYDVADTAGMLFPTGVGGVLYGPKSLSPEAVDEEMFTKLCPQGDDLWLFWMGRRVGSTYVKTPGRWIEFPWKGSQDSALHLSNVGAGRNDHQISELASHFGVPHINGLSREDLARLPFSGEQMLATIQKAVDKKGVLTPEESRQLWTTGSLDSPEA
ncbi:acyltransferase family protein [Mesorhizobium sp. B2-3-10]|uniref:acyltransferase family protein n=1 Tax=Mesorhizobium sp. B2-3-10 TaxID=2589954 RepID=UPI00112CC318|nr:acyltransferase family protein [Mesorhizobium sp. B2-3-10]TPM02112.1 acyltransferase family protein [Mesorhizobium sp. B2-3-10]